MEGRKKTTLGYRWIPEAMPIFRLPESVRLEAVEAMGAGGGARAKYPPDTVGRYTSSPGTGACTG